MTIFFIFIIISTGIYYSRKKDNIALMHSVPSILITLGILGTFVGIGFGLADFDPSSKDLTKSITPVITGIQSSVWASASGILASILFKIFVIKPSESKKEEDIPTLLNNIKDAIDNSSTQYNESLKKLLEEHSLQLEKTTKNIVTDLLSQTTMHLTKISEQKLENLFTKLSDASTQNINQLAKTSENSIKNLITTLSDTSTQEVTKLTQQLFNKFEDPVKHLIDVTSNLKSLEHSMLIRLNESTDCLISLAKNYEKLYKYNEELLNTMPTVFEKNAKLIENTANSIQQIANSSDHFTKNAENLDKILVQFPNLTQDIATRLKEIHEVKTLILQNTGDLNSMSGNLHQITSEIDRFSKELIANTNKSLQDLIQNISAKNNSSIDDKIELSLQEMKKSVDDLNDKFLQNFGLLGDSMNKLSDGFLKTFEIFIEKMNELIENSEKVDFSSYKKYRE